MLTDEEIMEVAKKYPGDRSKVEFWFARAIEEVILAKQAKAEPVGMFWHNGKGKWVQDTPEARIKGITHPLYTHPPLQEKDGCHYQKYLEQSHETWR